MSIVDVYGFDFDANTFIEFYSEPIVNKNDFGLYFEYANYNTISNQIISTYYFVTLSTHLDIRISSDNTLTITYRYPTYSIITYDLDNIDNFKAVYQVKNNIQNLYINGMLVATASNIIPDGDLDFDVNDYRIGGYSSGSCDGIMANYTIYNEALADQECIDITSGNFDSSDSRIVFIETFNEITLGEINTGGTEQYAIIGTKEIPDPDYGIKLYSKEQFENYFYSPTNWNNGSLVKSYSFNRNNYNSVIYVNYSLDISSFPSSQIKPICYRGYYDSSNVLTYDKTELQPVSESGNIFFNYVSPEERQYINYRIEFDCIGNIDSMTIDEVGLILKEEINNKGIFGTKNRSISFSSSNNRDINNNFSNYQVYQKTVDFTIETNRDNEGQIMQIISNPFKLIDIKNECIDNSTRWLSIFGTPAMAYSGTNTQYMSMTFKCIEDKK